MRNTKQRQQGSVFLISLMLLIVVTLLTFAVSESVMLQQKMSSSSKDVDLALQVSESALLDAEAAIKAMDLSTFNTGFTLTGGTAGIKGYYDGSDPLTCNGAVSTCYVNVLRDVFLDTTWTNAITATTGVRCGNGDVNCMLYGQFIIIKLGMITATGTGAAELEAVTNQYQSQSHQVTGNSWKYKIMARGRGNNSQNTRVLISYFIQTQPSS